MRKYFPEKVEYIYDCTIRKRVKMVQDRLKRDAIYATPSNNIKKSSNNSILALISKACRITPVIQQYNCTRLLVCSTFESGYSTIDIVMEICHFIFRATPPFEREKNKNKVPNLFEGDEEDLHARETLSCWGF